jgi:heme exporter protein C
VLFGVLTLVTGPLWARKSWGVWWTWDVRLTSSLVSWLLAGLVPAGAPLRRTGVRSAGRGAGALRHGQRAVHLHLGELLADDSPADDGRADRCRRRWAFPPGFASPAFLLLFVLLLRMRVRLEAQRARLDAMYLSLDE